MAQHGQSLNAITRSECNPIPFSPNGCFNEIWGALMQAVRIPQPLPERQSQRNRRALMQAVPTSHSFPERQHQRNRRALMRAVPIQSSKCNRLPQNATHLGNQDDFLPAHPSANSSFLERKTCLSELLSTKGNTWQNLRRRCCIHICLPYGFLLAIPREKHYPQTKQNKWQ